MATQALPFITPEQYLEYDRNSERPNEYIFGEILPMEATTESHCLIVANMIFRLSSKFYGTPCLVYATGLRVSLNQKKGYVYPDITVVCGQREYLDARKDTMTNPKIAVEVLSPSTSKYDLGPKARLYWKVPSLSDLIFIAQDQVEIEYWHRSSDEDWRRTVIESLSDILKIESSNIEIPLSEIYAGVDLPPADE
jgi:Uma2 family endonuclease